MKTVLGSKFDVRSFEAKNRVFEFDYQKINTFEFVRCSKNLCLSLFVKQCSKSSEGPIRVFEFNHYPFCTKTVFNCILHCQR